MDSSLPGSSLHGLLQEEYQSGLSFPSPGDLPDPGIEHLSLGVSCIAGKFFYHLSHQGNPERATPRVNSKLQTLSNYDAINVGSSSIKKYVYIYISFWWVMLIMRKAVHVWGKVYVENF